jgi:hypothetical protein
MASKTSRTTAAATVPPCTNPSCRPRPSRPWATPRPARWASRL